VVQKINPFLAGAGRRDPRPADHTPSRSWRLPDLFFLSGHSDGRGRLGTRRPPPVGCALRTVLSHRAPRGRRWPCGATPSITSVSDGSIWSSQLFLPIHSLSPCTARPPRGREEARSAGWWGSFEGWPCATPPCEERGAQHDATSTS